MRLSLVVVLNIQYGLILFKTTPIYHIHSFFVGSLKFIVAAKYKEIGLTLEDLDRSILTIVLRDQARFWTLVVGRVEVELIFLLSKSK